MFLVKLGKIINKILEKKNNKTDQPALMIFLRCNRKHTYYFLAQDSFSVIKSVKNCQKITPDLF